MKRSISWWLIRFIFLFVFVFNAILLYQYWSLTRKNLTVEVPVISPSPASKNSARLSSDAQGQSAAEGAFFKCPACGNATLTETSAEMLCESCGRHYPVAGGIYDFRVN